MLRVKKKKYLLLNAVSDITADRWVNGCVGEFTDEKMVGLDAWLGECVCWLFVGSRPAGPLAWCRTRKPIGRGLWRGLISRKPKLLLTNKGLHEL